MLHQVKKVNTSGYHPQTNGLVEKFNSTLISMISKVVEGSSRDLDQHLPILLFEYTHVKVRFTFYMTGMLAYQCQLYLISLHHLISWTVMTIAMSK